MQQCTLQSLYFWCYEFDCYQFESYKLLNKKKNYLVTCNSQTSNNQTRNTKNTGSISKLPRCENIEDVCKQHTHYQQLSLLQYSYNLHVYLGGQKTAFFSSRICQSKLFYATYYITRIFRTIPSFLQFYLGASLFQCEDVDQFRFSEYPFWAFQSLWFMD